MQFLSHDKRQEISCHNVSLQEKKKHMNIDYGLSVSS